MRRRWLVVGLAGALSLVLTACPAPEDEDERVAELEAQIESLEGQLADARADREAATPGTVEGLEESLRVAFPSDMPDWQPGLTPWEQSPAEVPSGFEQGAHDWQTPGELMVALLPEFQNSDQLGEGWGVHADGTPGPWEITLRALYVEDGEAYGIIQHWGLPDDAIAGQEWRFALHEDDDGWYVAEIDQRSKCRRGVQEGLCV